MSLRKWAFVPALLAFAALGTARADYSYQAAFANPASPNSNFQTTQQTISAGLPSGISVTFVPHNETVMPSSIYGTSYMGVYVTATNTTAVDFSGFNYAFRVTITNTTGTPPNQTGSFFIYGTLSGQGVSGSGGGATGVINNTYNLVTTTAQSSFPSSGGSLSASTTIGGSIFTFSEISPTGDYSKATINPTTPPGSGGFSGTMNPFTPSGVPEPASVVMLGLGLCGLGVVGLRKRLARA